MPKNIIGAWRAFSLAKQADIATAQAVNTLLYFTGEPLEPEPETVYLNDDEINGELLPTQHRLLTRKFEGSHKSKAFPHLVGLFASQAMGKDTVSAVGATTAYKHKLEVDKTVVELIYRTMTENDGSNQTLYTGVACSGFKLSGARGQFVEFEAALIGAGTEAADASAKPARVNESYLTYGDLKIHKGGSYNGTTVTGATELSGSLVDFSFEFKNNAKGVYKCGDPSGNVGRIQRGQKYSCDLKAKFEVEDASHRTDLLAGNEFALWIPMVGGVANGAANYTVELIFPRVFYKGAKKGYDDGTMTVAGDFGVLSDVTYGPFILHVINLQSASYLAAA
jgi:hypothetical protein